MLKIVYNKKIIQFFVMNMPFISSREVRKSIFHSLAPLVFCAKCIFASINEINIKFIPKIRISSLYLAEKVSDHQYDLGVKRQNILSFNSSPLTVHPHNLPSASHAGTNIVWM